MKKSLTELPEIKKAPATASTTILAASSPILEHRKPLFTRDWTSYSEA